MKKHLIKGLVIAVVITGVLWGRVYYLQRSHFMDAERYFDEKNYKLAIREYDTAMHFYTPFSPFVERSAQRLWHIGDMLEGAGHPDTALIAYSSIRSSFYASRSLYTPGKKWIEKCDEKIAELNVKTLLKEGSIKPGEAGAELNRHLYVLRVDRAPKPLWAVLVEVGFFGWVGSVVFIIFKGFDWNGKLRGRYAVYGAASFMLTFALWVLALIKA